MSKLTEITKSVKKKEIVRKWHLIDCNNQVLGRVATKIARLLQGKNKRNYVSYLDMGDYVVVINASKIIVTGNKSMQKEYKSYSGYPGGLKVKTFEKMLTSRPEEIIKRAVSGMLPKNKQRKKRMGRLHVFKDDKHPFVNKFSKSNN